MLVARTRDALKIAGPAAREAAAFDGFQSAFIVTVVLAALGALVAGIAFPRVARDVRTPSPEEEETVPPGGPGPAVPIGQPNLAPTITVRPVDPEG